MRKVLVVEDDKFISAIFTMFLRDLGHEMVGKCADGTDAVDLCHRLKPDVVLMDIHLEGDMDGIQTAEQLRRELDIPVIYVSSDTSSQVIKRAIVSNSYGFLVKPVNKKELGIAIDLAYYKHKVDQEQRERERGYRQFISDSPMPIMILQDGRIQYLNNLALDLFKTHYMEDVLMLPYLNFVNEQDKLKVEQLLSEFNKTGRGFEFMEVAMQDVHGQLVYVKISGASTIFNKKKSLQVTLVDNTAKINTQRRSDTLLEYMDELGLPYIISNQRNVITLCSEHPLFKGKKLIGEKLNSDNGFEKAGEDVLVYNNGNTQQNFKVIEVKDLYNEVFEHILVVCEDKKNEL